MSYHLEHEEHNVTVSSALACLPPDIMFISREGEQVEASSLLLSLHSPLLHSLLAERDKLEVTAVTMPLPASGLRTLVALLSSG